MPQDTEKGRLDFCHAGLLSLTLLPLVLLSAKPRASLLSIPFLLPSTPRLRFLPSPRFSSHLLPSVSQTLAPSGLALVNQHHPVRPILSSFIFLPVATVTISRNSQVLLVVA